MAVYSVESENKIKMLRYDSIRRLGMLLLSAMNHIKDCHCLCGEVRFSIPQPFHEVGLCHCGLCRRWTGGVPVFAGMAETVTITSGEALRWYAATSWGERGFCGRCGSSLFWREKGAKSNWMVGVGALPATDGLQLVRQIYIDDKPGYYNFSGDMPHLTGDQFMAQVSAEMPVLKRWSVRIFLFFLRLKNRLWPQSRPSDADQCGRCICGTVHFRLPRAPQDAHMCHCGLCRRWSGGAGVIGISTDIEDMETGDALRWYQTSAHGERGFCEKCGTALFWRGLGEGDVSVVSAGALEDDRGLHLHEHIYIDDKPDYYDVAGDAQRISGAEYRRRTAPASSD